MKKPQQKQKQAKTFKKKQKRTLVRPKGMGKTDFKRMAWFLKDTELAEVARN